MTNKLSTIRRMHPVLESIRHSPIATVVSDPLQADNPLIAVNAAFCAMTGYTEEESLHRNCRFLRGPDTENSQTDKLRAAIHARRPALAELINYRKDGSPFRNAVMIAPLFDENGELELFVGSQIEVLPQEESIALVRQQQAAEIVDRLSPRQREMLMFKKLATSNAADAVRIAVEAGL
jgi:PAS domain S-box-containing protein